MSDNGTSTLTLSAASTAALGAMGKVTVTATGSSVAQTVDVTYVVVAPPDMAMPPSTGGNGGSGGNGGNGTGGNGTGGNGLHGNGDSGCSMSGGSIGGAWAIAGLLLFALAFRRRSA
jgi:hypothetical protein